MIVLETVLLGHTTCLFGPLGPEGILGWHDCVSTRMRATFVRRPVRAHNIQLLYPDIELSSMEPWIRSRCVCFFTWSKVLFTCKLQIEHEGKRHPF